MKGGIVGWLAGFLMGALLLLFLVAAGVSVVDLSLKALAWAGGLIS